MSAIKESIRQELHIVAADFLRRYERTGANPASPRHRKQVK
jgi:hypothetical protein